MIYTDLTKKALLLAFEVYQNTLDKNNLPYIFHSYELASQMDTELEIVVALLHDVVEDTDYTFEDLQSLGFPEQCIEALKLLRHDSSIPYKDYIKGIKTNKLSCKVKIADLKHNSDISRLSIVTLKDEQRMAKYAKALEVLTSDK